MQSYLHWQLLQCWCCKYIHQQMYNLNKWMFVWLLAFPKSRYKQETVFFFSFVRGNKTLIFFIIFLTFFSFNKIINFFFPPICHLWQPLSPMTSHILFIEFTLKSYYKSPNVHLYSWGSTIFGPISTKISRIVSHAWKSFKLY